MSTMDVMDRGFAYGDGLFETLLLQGREPGWWSEHMARLRWGCHRLGLPSPDARALRAQVDAVIDPLPVGEQRTLKLIYTAGVGTRGYARSEGMIPTCRVLSGVVSPQIEGWRENGLVVGLLNQSFDGPDQLAGLKHLNRLPQVLARAAWPAGLDECLVSDRTGCVFGGTQSNFFWFEAGRWWTPPISGAGIAGTVRALLMTHLGVGRMPLAPGRLALAQAAVMTNALWGVLPVRRLLGRDLTAAPAQDLAGDYAVLCATQAGADLDPTETAWQKRMREEPMMREGGIS